MKAPAKGQAGALKAVEQLPRICVLAEEFRTEVTTLRGLLDLFQEQQDGLVEIVHKATGTWPWGEGGLFRRTPEISCRADAWHRRALVLMDAKDHLLAALDTMAAELDAPTAPGVQTPARDQRVGRDPLVRPPRARTARRRAA
jgi:hypothetical protein